MDRFKFRVLDKRDSKYYYDVENSFEENIVLGIDYFGQYLNDDDFIVEQYTGLKDKNGKLIYEGDIIGFKDSIKYKVKYKPYSSCAFCLCAEKYCHTLDDDLASDCEVIGNIHENPELLEDK